MSWVTPMAVTSLRRLHFQAHHARFAAKSAAVGVGVGVARFFFGCHVFVFIVYLHRFMCNETSIIRLFQLMAYVPITIG